MNEPLSLALNNGQWTPETAPRGGRPKGAVNKTTQEVRELARAFLEDPEYWESLRQRLLSGKAERIEALLFHYAYGKPKEILEVHPPESNIGGDGDFIEKLSQILATVPVEHVTRLLADVGAPGMDRTEEAPAGE